MKLFIEERMNGFSFQLPFTLSFLCVDSIIDFVDYFLNAARFLRQVLVTQTIRV